MTQGQYKILECPFYPKLRQQVIYNYYKREFSGYVFENTSAEQVSKYLFTYLVIYISIQALNHILLFF